MLMVSSFLGVTFTDIRAFVALLASCCFYIMIWWKRNIFYQNGSAHNFILVRMLKNIDFLKIEKISIKRNCISYCGKEYIQYVRGHLIMFEILVSRFSVEYLKCFILQAMGHNGCISLIHSSVNWVYHNWYRRSAICTFRTVLFCCSTLFNSCYVTWLLTWRLMPIYININRLIDPSLH